MNISNIVAYIYEARQLKSNKREGWRLAGIQHPESIADHSLRAAQLGYILAKMEQYENPEEVCTMVVFHDIGEARVGDIHKLANRYIECDETQAVRDQFDLLSEMGDDLFEMWLDQNQKRTEAGILAKDADLLELAFTAREYQELGHKRVSEWLESAKKYLQTDSAKKLLEELLVTDPFAWFKGLKSFK